MSTYHTLYTAYMDQLYGALIVLAALAAALVAGWCLLRWLVANWPTTIREWSERVYLLTCLLVYIALIVGFMRG